MVRIKVVKPGKWAAVIAVIIGLLVFAAGIRGIYLSRSAVEVFSAADTGTHKDSSKFISSLLRSVLDKAFPAMEAGTDGENKETVFEKLVKRITLLNYKDPKSFIVAELPIMASYDLPVPSRGIPGIINRGNPYDPEEDLNDILEQYSPGEIKLDMFGEGDDTGQGMQYQPPAKTILDLDNPVVLIYHTHTSEAYRPSKAYNYTPTDVDRTIDPRYSVVRVGRELRELLEAKHGIKSVHITTFHDYPEYTPSYARSLDSVRNVLAKYPSIKIILDIHRDAFPMRNQAEQKRARALSAMKLGGKDTARLMLVWGPDAPNSSETRKFAELLKNRINRQSPGLCRQVLEKPTGRYNQQLSDYSALIEVGSNANTMEEALASIPHLARAIAETIKEIGE